LSSIGGEKEAEKKRLELREVVMRSGKGRFKAPTPQNSLMGEKLNLGRGEGGEPSSETRELLFCISNSAGYTEFLRRVCGGISRKQKECAALRVKSRIIRGKKLAILRRKMFLVPYRLGEGRGGKVLGQSKPPLHAGWDVTAAHQSKGGTGWKPPAPPSSS